MEKPNLILHLLPLLLVAPLISSCGILNLGMSKEEAAFEAKRADLEARMSQKGKIVYAIKDIPEGYMIPADALAEKEFEMSKIPQDALTSSSLTRGCYAKYGISQGQIVSQYDIVSPNSESLVLKLDSKYMNKLKDLAGDNPEKYSSAASLLLKKQLDRIYN